MKIKLEILVKKKYIINIIDKKCVNYADIIDVLIYEYRQEQAVRRY